MMNRIRTKLRTTPADQQPRQNTSRNTHRGAAVLGNLLTRDDGTSDAGVWAYYLLTGHDHQYVADDDRDRAYMDHVHRWSDLAGKRVWLNGLRNPFNVDAYVAAQLARPHTAASGDHWADTVTAAAAIIEQYESAAPVTTLGVRVSATPVNPDHLHYVAGSGPIPNELTYLHAVRAERAAVDSAVSRDGWKARKLTGAELRWVIHANRSLGATPPALITDIGREHENTWRAVGGFTDPVHATAGDYTPTVRLAITRDNTVLERHVRVQPVERFDPRAMRVDDNGAELGPLGYPWLAWAASLDDEDIGPVAYTLIGEVIPGDELVRKAAHRRRRAENSVEGYEEHGKRVPLEVQRAVEHAVAVEDEVSTGAPEVAARFVGVALFATVGATDAEALTRARNLRARAAREQKITLADAYGQYHLYRAFMPGAPESASDAVIGGFRTTQPVRFLATAEPNAYTSASDALGMPIGPVGGSPELFIYDPHYGPGHNESGLSAFFGMQGAGKSTLVAALTDWSAQQGNQNVFTDPSGLMSRICDLPWHKDDSYVFELGKARPGCAVPSMLVPEPQRSDYSSNVEYVDAVRSAEAGRVAATLNVFRALLPTQVLERETDVSIAIEEVVREHGREYGADPRRLCELMDRNGGSAGTRAARLLRTRGHGSVFFPAPGVDIDVEAERVWSRFNSARLVGISMEGVEVPEPGTPRELWSTEQQESAPLLVASSLIAMRVMYANRLPCQITLDELGILAASGQGAAGMLRRAAVESRKWGATVNVVGQTPGMFTSLGDQVSSLVGFAAVGMMDADTAKHCLPLLALPAGAGYEREIAGLGPGTFLIRRAIRSGPDGRERQIMRRNVYVERSWWHPLLVDALDTTPEGVPAGVDVESLGMFR